MFEYFYHEIIRKTVIAFGTLFNGMEIRRLNSSGEVTSEITVPIAYGPTQKFLARLEQSPDLNRPFTITLPRMSFEVVGINYDPRRKTTVTQQFVGRSKTDKTQFKKAYMPVPYDLDFELSIMTKHNDDMLQIIEQILPYFQPSFNITINLVSSIGEKKDVPIVLNGITMATDYEGSFTDLPTIQYNLNFSAKTYLFGAIASETSGLIKKVDVDMYSNTTSTAKREVRYSVTPRAIKDYNNDSITHISEDISLNETIISLNSASTFSAEDYIEIGSETMEIVSVDGNTIKVKRGVEGTGPQEHYTGDRVNAITTSDDALIPLGDDFGFNETTSFFSDFKTYNPVTGEDI